MITGGLLVVIFFSPPDGLDLGETAQLDLTFFFWWLRYPFLMILLHQFRDAYRILSTILVDPHC